MRGGQASRRSGQIVVVAVFRADEELQLSVAVPVGHGGAGVVAFQFRGSEGALIFEARRADGVRAGVAPEVRAYGIQQEIDRTVAVPIGQAEFAPARLAALLVIQPQWLSIRPGEDALSRLQEQMWCMER